MAIDNELAKKFRQILNELTVDDMAHARSSIRTSLTNLSDGEREEWGDWFNQEIDIMPSHDVNTAVQNLFVATYDEQNPSLANSVLGPTLKGMVPKPTDDKMRRSAIVHGLGGLFFAAAEAGEGDRHDNLKAVSKNWDSRLIRAMRDLALFTSTKPKEHPQVYSDDTRVRMYRLLTGALMANGHSPDELRPVIVGGIKDAVRRGVGTPFAVLGSVNSTPEELARNAPYALAAQKDLFKIVKSQLSSRSAEPHTWADSAARGLSALTLLSKMNVKHPEARKLLEGAMGHKFAENISSDRLSEAIAAHFTPSEYIQYILANQPRHSKYTSPEWNNPEQVGTSLVQHATALLSKIEANEEYGDFGDEDKRDVWEHSRRLLKNFLDQASQAEDGEGNTTFSDNKANALLRQLPSEARKSPALWSAVVNVLPSGFEPDPEFDDDIVDATRAYYARANDVRQRQPSGRAADRMEARASDVGQKIRWSKLDPQKLNGVIDRLGEDYTVRIVDSYESSANSVLAVHRALAARGKGDLISDTHLGRSMVAKAADKELALAALPHVMERIKKDGKSPLVHDLLGAHGAEFAKTYNLDRTQFINTPAAFASGNVAYDPLLATGVLAKFKDHSWDGAYNKLPYLAREAATTPEGAKILADFLSSGSDPEDRGKRFTWMGRDKIAGLKLNENTQDEILNDLFSDGPMRAKDFVHRFISYGNIQMTPERLARLDDALKTGKLYPQYESLKGALQAANVAFKPSEEAVHSLALASLRGEQDIGDHLLAEVGQISPEKFADILSDDTVSYNSRHWLAHAVVRNANAANADLVWNHPKFQDEMTKLEVAESLASNRNLTTEQAVRTGDLLAANLTQSSRGEHLAQLMGGHPELSREVTKRWETAGEQSLAYRVRDSIRSAVSAHPSVTEAELDQMVHEGRASARYIVANRDSLSIPFMKSLVAKSYEKDGKYPTGRLVSDLLEKQKALAGREGLRDFAESVKSIYGDSYDNSGAQEKLNEAIAFLDPDSIHNQSVAVRFDTHKLRKLRDSLTGPTPKGKIQGFNPNWGPLVADNKGVVTPEKIQQHIDSLPAHKFNIAHTEWGGPQRHSSDDSKVFQLQMTTAHIDELEKAGLMGAFKEMHRSSYTSSHPATPNTLGWVRWTGSPQEGGIQIDEIQSDFGQRTMRNEKIDEDQKNKVFEILFAGRHPSETLHEAFHQHLRDLGWAGTPVHIHHWKTKGPISGMDMDKPLPQHMLAGYSKIPEKMGYKPAEYGKLPTQSNDQHKGKHQYEEQIRKMEDLFVDEPLQKGVLGAVAGIALSQMSPQLKAGFDKVQLQPQIEQVKMQAPKWTADGLHANLVPIAHLESSFGKNMNHLPHSKGEYHTAYGPVGMKPSTAHEEWTKSKALKDKFPGLEEPSKFMEKFKNDWAFHNLVASSHFMRLMHRHGSPEKAAYAWRWGSTAAANASDETISKDNYVMRYRDLAASSGIKKSEHSITVQHFSPVDGLKELHPKHMGTGMAGAERNRPNRIPRIYLYTRPGTPEGIVTAGAPHQYHGELPHGTKLYDIGKDELGLNAPKWKQTKNGMEYHVPDLNQVERKLKRMGYHGYHNYGVKDAIAYFHSLPVTQVGPNGKPLRKDEQQPNRFEEWYRHSKLLTPDGKPLKMFRGVRRAGTTKGYLDTESYTDSPEIASIYSATPGNPWGTAKGSWKAKWGEGASVYPVHINMTNPLDLRHMGHQGTFGQYLEAMQYLKPNGMTFEEAGKVLNYLVNRHAGKVNAGQFEYKLYDEDGGYIDPEDDDLYPLTFGGPYPTPLRDFRQEHKDMMVGPKDAHRLKVDTFALVDAPASKRVAQRLGHDGIIHHDVFTPPKELLEEGKKPHEIQGVKPIKWDGSVLSHVTYRPFEPHQVKSVHNVGTYSDDPDILKSEEDLNKMAIKDIRPGAAIDSPNDPAWGDDAYDYSHVLPKKLRKDYRIIVTRHRPLQHRKVTARVFHTPTNKNVGFVAAYITGLKTATLDIAELREAHRGKGIGTHAYEALYADLYHNHGVRKIEGDTHSSSAGRAHQKISEKHGLDYPYMDVDIDAKIDSGRASGLPYDSSMGPYDYKLR